MSLAEICKDLYCILRFYPFENTPGPKRGRELEKVFDDYCLSKSLRLVEHPGSSTLFGYKSLSGIGHEVDGSINGGDWKLHIELKAYRQEVPKDQVMLFNERSLDYYFAFFRNGKSYNLYRAFVTDSPLELMVRRFCYSWSIITVEPDRLPIPVILEYLRREKWEQFFEFGILQEVERILPRYSLPLDQILVRIYDPLPSICIKGSMLPSPKDLDEIEEIHAFISDEVLETIEEADPEHFEGHTEKLLHDAGLFT